MTEPGTAPRAVTPPRRRDAALIGAVGALTALAAGELVTAIAGSGTSLVTAVANAFVDRFAASLKDLAVELFGTNDKIALVVGIVVVSVGVAAALGIGSRRWRPAAPSGIVVFGAVGAWALAIDPQGDLGVALAAGGVAVVAGTATVAGLWIVAAGESRTATAPPVASGEELLIRRRRLLVASGGLLVVSGAGAVLARRLRAGDSIAEARRTTVLPRAGRAVEVPATTAPAIPGLTPYVTSTGDFFRIDTAIITPQIDADSWTVRIAGLVDRPFSLRYDELIALDSVSVPITIQCVSNEVGGDLVGTAVWQGVPLAELLDRAGVRSEAGQVVGRSVDGFSAGFPLAAALDGRDAIVAYAMNGEPLTAAHGYPARLVVPGLYGYVSATKWLETIELATWEGVDGFWITRGWSKHGPIKTASRIDVPRDEVAAGRQAVAGVAWAPGRGIDRVEVQIDDGAWTECRLGRTASDDTWVQWWLEWDARPGAHVLRVRATDGTGETQTGERRSPAPDGATGWHSRTVYVV